jgi:hypothetical protein
MRPLTRSVNMRVRLVHSAVHVKPSGAGQRTMTFETGTKQ